MLYVDWKSVSVKVWSLSRDFLGTFLNILQLTFAKDKIHMIDQLI